MHNFDGDNLFSQVLVEDSVRSFSPILTVNDIVAITNKINF